MNDKPDEFPDEDEEADDEQAPEPPSGGAQRAHGEAEPVGDVRSADEAEEHRDEQAPVPPPIEAGQDQADVASRELPPGETEEQPRAGAFEQDQGDFTPPQPPGETEEQPKEQAPEPPFPGAAQQGEGEAHPVAEQELPDDDGEWPEERAPEPPVAAIRDEHPVPSAEDTGTLPPEFEPTTPPEPGSEQDDRPGDPRSELPEDGEAPEPPWTPAEAGPVLSPSEDPPEQTSVRSDQAFPTEEPPHETTGTDGPREQPLTAEGNEPHLSTIDERPHPGSEKPSVSTDEADSGRDATEAPSADSFAEATTQGTIGGARERPPADGPAGSDSRAAIRDAWRSAQEARLEQAVGRLPEPVETPPTRPADSDELTAVDTPVAASEIDQGDLIREDPDMAEAVAEVLRQFGSAMGRLPGYESLGQAVQHAGNGIGMVDAWRANRHLGAAEAINAGLDALVDALGGGKDMNVPTVMDPLKDRIRAIVGARFPAPGDAYGQPPLIRSNRRRRDESQP